MRTEIVTLIAVLGLVACAAETPEPADATVEEPTERQIESLADAVAAPWRSAEEIARDEWRNPEATLDFFGVEPTDTVAEIWPGGGWYTNIIAPYLAAGGGSFIAVHWDAENAAADRQQRFSDAIARYVDTYSDPEIYGQIEVTAFSAASAAFAEPESVDVILTFRNVHNWIAGDYAAKFFSDAYDALKPGGVLGVVDHRLPSSREQDPRASSGYVHEDVVRRLAEAAGFEFVEASEINANPADTADHPFGVWTLPPVSRTTDADGNTPEGFDADAYVAIGESDRMTLKFIKPTPDETPAED